MDGNGALRNRQFDQRRAQSHVEGGAHGADDGGPGLHVEGAGTVMSDVERGFALQDADLAAVIGEADFRGAVAVEMQSGAVVQRDVADLPYLRLLMVHAAAGADGADG